MTRLPEDPSDPREGAKLFNELIRPQLTGLRRDNPIVLWVGGPPGAGKSTIQSAILARLGRSDAFPLDGDDLLAYHPAYAGTHQRNDLTAAYLVGEDEGGRWWSRAARLLRIARIDTAISAPLGGAEWAAARFGEFRGANYRVEVAFVAVHEALSQQGIVDRYRRMKLASPDGVGRWVLPETHQALYVGTLEAIDELHRLKACDAIHIGVRGGAIIHSNELDDNGQWRLDVLPSQVIQAQRNLPLTLQTSADFLRTQGTLREWAPAAEWVRLLDEIDRTAVPVIHPVSVLDDRQLTQLRMDIAYRTEEAALRADNAQIRAKILNLRQADGTNDRILARLEQSGATPDEVERVRSSQHRERWGASMDAANSARHAAGLSTLSTELKGEATRRTNLPPEDRAAEERGRLHHRDFNPDAADRVLPAAPARVEMSSPVTPGPSPTRWSFSASDTAPAPKRQPRPNRSATERLGQFYAQDSTPTSRRPAAPSSGSPSI